MGVNLITIIHATLRRTYPPASPLIDKSSITLSLDEAGSFQGTLTRDSHSDFRIHKETTYQSLSVK